MEFTELDRNALYDIWMSQKAKMHLTQMEMAKRLGISLHEFSSLLNSYVSNYTFALDKLFHPRLNEISPVLVRYICKTALLSTVRSATCLLKAIRL